MTLMTEASTPQNTPETMPFPPMVNSLPNDRGFTLIEVIVVFAIIGVLALMATEAFTDLKDKAKVAKASQEIRNLEKDISSFAVEKGYYPDGLTDIGKAGMLDPWGKAYEYKRYVNSEMRSIGAGIELNSDFDLYSKGKDGLTDLSIEDPASTDDICRLRDGTYVGTSESFMN